MKQSNITLILTSTIDPRGTHFLKRNKVEDRLNDYKKSFNFWCNRNEIKKIIFVENSGFDLSYFNDHAEKIIDKKIEIISSNVNDSYDKKLGKGYGEYLCYKEIITKSQLLKETEYFIIVTGRHIIQNFSNIHNEFTKSESDICLNLIDNLRFADANIYYGTLNFFKNYVVPETEKVMALLCFNIGVEIGQLLFVAALFMMFYLGSKLYKSLTKDTLRFPVSYLCGSLACIWMLERLAAF